MEQEGRGIQHFKTVEWNTLFNEIKNGHNTFQSKARLKFELLSDPRGDSSNGSEHQNTFLSCALEQLQHSSHRTSGAALVHTLQACLTDEQGQEYNV